MNAVKKSSTLIGADNAGENRVQRLIQKTGIQQFAELASQTDAPG